MKKSKDGAGTMTGETRVSLVVGLLFIILFGLILSEITGVSGRDRSAQSAQAGTPAAPPRGGQIIPAAAQEPAHSPEAFPEPPRQAVEPARSAVLPPPLPRLPSSAAGATVAPAPAPARVEPARAVPPVADAAEASEAQVRTHVVRAGETLGRIAATYYGQANAAKGVKLILEANRDRVESAARLRINTELAIPPMK